MTTDLATRPQDYGMRNPEPDALDRALAAADNRAPIVLGPADGVAFLQQWATATGFLAGIARQLAMTPFIPQGLRAARSSREQTESELLDITTANVTACILSGQELGLHPMAALRSVDVIQGTPALRALAMRALVQSAGHRLTLIESTQTFAIVEGQRKGPEGYETPQRVRFSIDDAQRMGLMNKDNWKKQPGTMCIARASTGAARLIAADVLLAIPYSVEEIDDGLETVEPATVTEAEIVRPRAAAKKAATAQRRDQPAERATTGSARRGPATAAPGASIDNPLDDQGDTPSASSSSAGGAPSATTAPSTSPSGGTGSAPSAPSSSPDDAAAASGGGSAQPDNPASERARRRLLSICSGLGLTNRDRRLIVLSGVAGRVLTSSTELDADEVQTVSDTLEQHAKAGPEGDAEVEGIYQAEVDRRQDEAHAAEAGS